MAIQDHPHWKAQFERLATQVGAIARKLLAVLWPVPDRACPRSARRDASRHPDMLALGKERLVPDNGKVSPLPGVVKNLSPCFFSCPRAEAQVEFLHTPGHWNTCEGCLAPLMSRSTNSPRIRWISGKRALGWSSGTIRYSLAMESGVGWRMGKNQRLIAQ